MVVDISPGNSPATGLVLCASYSIYIYLHKNTTLSSGNTRKNRNIWEFNQGGGGGHIT